MLSGGRSFDEVSGTVSGTVSACAGDGLITCGAARAGGSLVAALPVVAAGAEAAPRTARIAAGRNSEQSLSSAIFKKPLYKTPGRCLSPLFFFLLLYYSSTESRVIHESMGLTFEFSSEPLRISAK